MKNAKGTENAMGRSRRYRAGALVTAAASVAGVMGVVGGIPPAQAASIMTTNACQYNFDEGVGYHFLDVTLSGTSPASVAAGQTVTLSDVRVSLEIPQAYVEIAFATYDGNLNDVYDPGVNNIPFRLYVAIAGSDTVEGTAVASLPPAAGAMAQLTLQTSGSTLIPTTGVKVTNVLLPPITFTAASSGTISFSQAFANATVHPLGSLTGAGIGNSTVTPAGSIYGGGALLPGLGVRADCAAGTPNAPEYETFTPVPAAPFSSTSITGTPVSTTTTVAPATTTTVAPVTTTTPGATTTTVVGATTTTAPTSIPQTGTWQCISGLGRQAAATNGGSTEILPLDITLSTGQTAQAAAGQVRLRQPRVSASMPAEYFLRAYRANQLLAGPNTYQAFVWLAVQATNTQEGIQTMALEVPYTVTVVDGGGTTNDGNESIAEADAATGRVTQLFTMPTTLWTPLGTGLIAFSAAPQGTMSTIGIQGQGEGNNAYQVNPYGSVFIRHMTAQYGSNLDCVNGTVTVNTTPPVTPYSNFGRLVSAARYSIVNTTDNAFRTFNVTATNASALSYQVITVNVVGRPLSFDALAHTVSMNPAGPGEVATGALKQLTIKDPRGTNAGWTVTGQVTPTAGPQVASTVGKSADFVSTSPTGVVKTIPANNLAWRPSVSLAPSQPPGGTPQATAGPGLTDTSAPWVDGLATARTLCSGVPSHSGGVFYCNAALYLGIPGDASKGTYTGNLTLTLS